MTMPQARVPERALQLAAYLSQCVGCPKVFVAHEGMDFGDNANGQPWRKGYCLACWTQLKDKPAIAHKWADALDMED